MDSVNVLDNTKACYQSDLKCKKWHVALRAGEQQAKYMALFKKQSLRYHHLSDIAHLADMAEQQLANFMDALEKLDPELEHPPPRL